MSQTRHFDELISRIYEAGAGEVDVNDVLRDVAEYLDMGVAVMVNTHDRYARGGCIGAYGIDPVVCTRAEHEHKITASTSVVDGREMRAGEFAFHDQLIKPEDLRRQAWYQDFVIPNRLTDCVKICLENSAERGVFVNLARPAPGADRAWQERNLKMLAPHWARAMRLFIRLEQGESMRHAVEELTGISRHAVVLLDNGGDLHVANRKAETLLVGDGLTLAREGLRANLDADQQRLQAAVRNVLASTARPEATPVAEELSIKRPSGRRPYHLMLVPMTANRHLYGRRPAAAVLVFDPEEHDPVPLDRCCALFGFTRAEGQVALAIMRGLSTEEIARESGRTITTTRNLLKRAFQKAGVNRQSELMRVMLNSPLTVPRRGEDTRAASRVGAGHARD